MISYFRFSVQPKKKFLTQYSRTPQDYRSSIILYITTSLSIAAKLVDFSHQKAEYGFPTQFKWLISVMEQGWATFSTFLLVCDPANGNRGLVAKRNSETKSAH